MLLIHALIPRLLRVIMDLWWQLTVKRIKVDYCEREGCCRFHYSKHDLMTPVLYFIHCLDHQNGLHYFIPSMADRYWTSLRIFGRILVSFFLPRILFYAADILLSPFYSQLFRFVWWCKKSAVEAASGGCQMAASFQNTSFTFQVASIPASLFKSPLSQALHTVPSVVFRVHITHLFLDLSRTGPRLRYFGTEETVHIWRVSHSPTAQ